MKEDRIQKPKAQKNWEESHKIKSRNRESKRKETFFFKLWVCLWIEIRYIRGRRRFLPSTREGR